MGRFRLLLVFLAVFVRLGNLQEISTSNDLEEADEGSGDMEIKPKVLGDQCTDAADCPYKGSACNGNKCACKANYKDVNLECIPKVLNDPCTQREDCDEEKIDEKGKWNTYLQCFNSVCGCEITDNYNANTQKCSQRGLGHKCEEDAHCKQTNNTACIADKCKCKQAYKSVKTECEQTELGDACIENADCSTKSSMCFNRECTCKAGYNKKDNVTCGNKTLGDNCFADEGCSSIANSNCIEGKCRCMGMFKPVANKCNRTKIPFGAACESDDWCWFTNGSVCLESNHTCGCPHGMTRNNTQCVLKTEGVPVDEFNESVRRAKKCVCLAVSGVFMASFLFTAILFQVRLLIGPVEDTSKGHETGGQFEKLSEDEQIDWKDLATQTTTVTTTRTDTPVSAENQTDKSDQTDKKEHSDNGSDKSDEKIDKLE